TRFSRDWSSDVCSSDLVIDGAGELETTSVFHGDGSGITVIDRFHDHSNGSLAWFYGMVTAYLGFEFNSDEYKVMGLAPYGDHRRSEERRVGKECRSLGS